MYQFMQRLGRSLMLPVAVLPAAALIIAVGNTLKYFHLAPPQISGMFFTAGTAILEQLGILFAIGVAIGMAKKADGAVALAAVVGFGLITTVLKPEKLAETLSTTPDKLPLGFDQMNNANVFVGLIVGLIAAWAYNKFSHTELPMALSFFSGKRLVPIVTAVLSFVLAIILLFIWPFVFTGLTKLGESILGLGPIGAGLFGFFNRLLIPTGLHHALNNVFWFDLAGVNDISKFQTGHHAIKGETGRYMAGYFPVMMFGIPAAALAMYHTAKSEQKKRVAGILLAGSITAFVVGVTEPIEFAFMFVAPVLFFIHAVLTGLSMFIAASFHWTAGFSFSAGLLDLIMSFINPVANKPWMLVVQGIVFFVIYYVVFRVAIQVFNLQTPGRGEAIVEQTVDHDTTSEGSKYTSTAKQILEGLGGNDNIESIGNCATRLRVQLKDNQNIDAQLIKSAGAVGVTKQGKQNVQVIIGTHVQHVADEIESLRS